MATERAPALDVSVARRPRTQVRRLVTGPVGGTVLTLGVVVAVFAGLLPRLADYGDARTWCGR